MRAFESMCQHLKCASPKREPLQLSQRCCSLYLFKLEGKPLQELMGCRAGPHCARKDGRRLTAGLVGAVRGVHPQVGGPSVEEHQEGLGRGPDADRPVVGGLRRRHGTL